jgi:hypothetical protein
MAKCFIGCIIFNILDGVLLWFSYAFLFMLDHSFADHDVVFRNSVFCNILIEIDEFPEAEK